MASTGAQGTGIGFDTRTPDRSYGPWGMSPVPADYGCAAATKTSGTTYRSGLSFKTDGAPAVTRRAASSVASTSATLNGSANPNGLATTAWFRYWSGSSPGTCTDSGGTQTTVNNFAAGI